MISTDASSMHHHVLLAALAGGVLGAAGAGQATAQNAEFFDIPSVSGEAGSSVQGCYVSGSSGRAGVIVSGNGQVVATISREPGVFDGSIPFRVIRWTQATGSTAITPIGAASGNFPTTAISFDGNTIYGDWWRWRATAGYQDLRRRLSDNLVLKRTIFGCSSDGLTVTGTQGRLLTDQVIDFFRWNPDSIVPPVILPRTPDFAAGYFYFNTISGDGNVFAGSASWGNGAELYAGVVINSTGTNQVTQVGSQNQVTDLSFDGSVAVGAISTGATSAATVRLAAFRWTAETGAVELDPTISPTGGSFARAVNADGSVVVGAYLFFGDDRNRAFYWVQGRGAVDLRDDLVELYGLGSALAGWQLVAATDVSADGRTIVGLGINPGGCEQAFLVRLPALPTPACGQSDVAGPGQALGFDGQLTADDIIVYLNWFFAGDTQADVAGPGQSTTPDGLFTADDIIVFLNRLFAGC